MGRRYCAGTDWADGDGLRGEVGVGCPLGRTSGGKRKMKGGTKKYSK